jgi:glycosyltransferase 2 family protein
MSVESTIKLEHRPKEQEQSLDQDTSRIGKQSRKGLQLALRIAVTVVMFFFLLHSVSWPRLFTTLMKAQHATLLMGLTIGGMSIIFSTYSWRSLVLAERIQTDLARLIHLYLVGIAFSHFLPTSMGGDVAKAYYVGKGSGNMAGAASSVLLSRVTGFLGMLLISIPALFIWHSLFKQTIVIGFLLLSLLLITLVSGTLIASTLLPRLSDRFFNTKWFTNRIVITAIEVGNALSCALKRPRALCAAIGFSFLFWICGFLNYYGFAMALHMQVPLPFYIVAIAFASIVAFFPISINGYGVREGALVYVFSTMHVPASTSLLLAFLVDMQVLLFGLIGGSIYLTMGNEQAQRGKGESPYSS